jgi:solute:Na+ symporter, SSS family
MRLRLPDILIIVAYLLATVAIGLYYRKKSSQDKDSYMLGGKSPRSPRTTALCCFRG